MKAQCSSSIGDCFAASSPSHKCALPLHAPKRHQSSPSPYLSGIKVYRRETRRYRNPICTFGGKRVDSAKTQANRSSPEMTRPIRPSLRRVGPDSARSPSSTARLWRKRILKAEKWKGKITNSQDLAVRHRALIACQYSLPISLPLSLSLSSPPPSLSLSSPSLPRSVSLPLCPSPTLSWSLSLSLYLSLSRSLSISISL